MRTIFVILALVMVVVPVFAGPPSPPSNVRVIFTTDRDAVAPKSPPLTPDQDMQRGGSNREWDELQYRSSKPVKPDTGPVYNDFNRATDRYQRYQDEMWDWRNKGAELRRQYNDPQGFKTIR